MLVFFIFMYGVSFGFPDLALDFSGTRIRLDDLFLVLIFLSFLLQRRIIYLNQFHYTFLLKLSYFGLFCLLSLIFCYFLKLPFNSYAFFRMLGCLLIIYTVPFILKDSFYKETLLRGLVIGGAIFLTQVLWKWQSIMLLGSQLFIKDFYMVKSGVSFETWNPNAVANFAFFFTVSFLLLKKAGTYTKNYLFWLLACFFSLVPFLIFSRGASLCIIVSWALWFLISRKHMLFKSIIISVITLVFLILLSKFSFLLNSASRINISTGEGFAGRYELWSFSLNTIRNHLFLGLGFGQEAFLFEKVFGSGMSHNSFLSVLIELGVFGLLLFINPLIYLLRNLQRRFKQLRDEKSLIAYSFFIGFLIFNLSQSELYWYKAGILSLCILASPLICDEENFSRLEIRIIS